MRLMLVVLALLAVPMTPALASDLDELLERSSEASFSAEQIISCSTPDGSRDALVELSQDGDAVRIGAYDSEIVVGSGSWALTRNDGAVSGASVEAGKSKTEPLYEVQEGETLDYLGRESTSYRLLRDGVLRAELVFDVGTGALLNAVTFLADGAAYCERRFVSFDPEGASGGSVLAADPAVIAAGSASMPELILGFELLDTYADDDGLVFAYYSDGFFSFAVFETRAGVNVPDAVTVELASGVYQRTFEAGYVTYTWVTRDAGMALVGDLPPDMHESILSELPAPQDPGIFRRWWRALFG